MRPQSDEAKTEIASQLLDAVWPKLLSEPKLKTHIFKTFELDDCMTAHQLMESGEHRGKLVLKVS